MRRDAIPDSDRPQDIRFSVTDFLSTFGHGVDIFAWCSPGIFPGHGQRWSRQTAFYCRSIQQGRVAKYAYFGAVAIVGLLPIERFPCRGWNPRPRVAQKSFPGMGNVVLATQLSIAGRLSREARSGIRLLWRWGDSEPLADRAFSMLDRGIPGYMRWKTAPDHAVAPADRIVLPCPTRNNEHETTRPPWHSHTNARSPEPQPGTTR